MKIVQGNNRQQIADNGQLRAVIFDWAGTTVDYGCIAPAIVFREIFAQQGVEITIAEARGPMGMAKRDHIRTITQMPDVAARWTAAHGRAPGEDDVAAMYAAFAPLQIAALADYAALIPGTLETIAACRERGLKIGSTTGYNQAMMAVLMPEAARRGYQPDVCITPDEVAAGRPAPWMALLTAIRLDVYPMAAIVKIGDTLPDIAEGLNAGMWTIGLTQSGNELGLSQIEAEALAPQELATQLAPIAQRMHAAGAHYTAPTLAEVPAILDEIAARVEQGERP